MPAISVSLKADVYIGLENAAKSSGFTKSKITEMALSRFLEEMKENQEDAELGISAWNDFVASGKKGKSLAEVGKELDL